MTTSDSKSSQPRQKRLAAISAVAGTLALCVCVIGLVGVGGYFFANRPAAANRPAVEYVLDASLRMAQPTRGGTRLAIAQSVLAEIVRPADTSLTAGLRVFGSGATADACQDTDLLVPLAEANQGQITQTLSTVQTGASSVDSALASAMIAGIRDLAQTSGAHTLVVVTGGADSCDAEAGELIRQEAERAGISLQMFVVGFEVDEQEALAIKAMIEATAGSAYLNAPDQETLQSILTSIQSYIAEPTGAALSSVVAAADPVAVAVSPTGAPGATSTSEEVASEATSSSTSETPAYQPQTACDHPYMPLRTGATWQYSNGSIWTVESVTGDLNSATATVVSARATGSFWTFTWACSASGLDVYHTGNSSITASFEISDQTGAMLAGIADLVPGAAWNSGHTNTTTGQNTITIDVLSASHTAGDLQSFSLGSDTFEVIPLTTTVTESLTQTDVIVGSTQSNTYTGAYTVYFARGIGLVRIEGFVPNIREGAATGLELVSYDLSQ